MDEIKKLIEQQNVVLGRISDSIQNNIYEKQKLDLSELCVLGAKHRSDKTPVIGHSYTLFYHNILGPIRNRVKKVFEIGIGFQETMPVVNYKVGASLYMWEDYFPNAQIYSCDIRADLKIETDRIKTFRCDQSQSGDLSKLAEDLGGNFDLIVDDGSHVSDHQIISAIALVPYLSEYGYYFIEDVHKDNVVKVTDQLRRFGFTTDVHRFKKSMVDDIIISVQK